MPPNRPLNRIPPKLDPPYNLTYGLSAPFASHWRPASCEEAGCLAFRNGWRVRLDGLPPQKVHAARASGRKYTELHIAEGESYLVFEPGQPCFRSAGHRVRVERPGIFVVRDGDYRRYLGTGRRFEGRRASDDWVESFAENQDGIARLQARG